MLSGVHLCDYWTWSFLTGIPIATHCVLIWNSPEHSRANLALFYRLASLASRRLWRSFSHLPGEDSHFESLGTVPLPVCSCWSPWGVYLANLGLNPAFPVCWLVGSQYSGDRFLEVLLYRAPSYMNSGPKFSCFDLHEHWCSDPDRGRHLDVFQQLHGRQPPHTIDSCRACLTCSPFR